MRASGIQRLSGLEKVSIFFSHNDIFCEANGTIPPTFFFCRLGVPDFSAVCSLRLRRGFFPFGLGREGGGFSWLD